MKRLIRDMLISSAACSLESAGTGTVGRRKTGSPIGGDKRNLSHVISQSVFLFNKTAFNQCCKCTTHVFCIKFNAGLFFFLFFSPTIYLNHHRFEGDFFFTEEIQS